MNASLLSNANPLNGRRSPLDEGAVSGQTAVPPLYTPADIQTSQAVSLGIVNSDIWATAQTANWTTAADWSNGVPTSSSVVVIQQGEPQITSAATAASVEVQNGAKLSIGATLTLGAAGLTLDGGSTLHFPSIQSTSFAVHLAGNATIDTGPVTSDDDVLSGVISGVGSLTTAGGSNLELDGANTFSGGVTANGAA